MSWRNWDWVKALTESACPSDNVHDGTTARARDEFFYNEMQDRGLDPNNSDHIAQFQQEQDAEWKRRGVDPNNRHDGASMIANPNTPHEYG